ncbi:hypothetical protein [Amaricoccus sp.]|uniref:hypothetical protein n=1 Tax=Amaricoccus sp. TaxID=1872485 RepID=UPI001B581B64|nr:hypothetical protein [Amaricoccus sp.]MBP7002159.1 hypothetical protein [Amaricoccus sp.]
MAFPLFDLSGRLALAAGLAAHGATVVLNGRDEGKLAAAAAGPERRRAVSCGGSRLARNRPRCSAHVLRQPRAHAGRPPAASPGLPAPSRRPRLPLRREVLPSMATREAFSGQISRTGW